MNAPPAVRTSTTHREQRGGGAVLTKLVVSLGMLAVLGAPLTSHAHPREEDHRILQLHGDLRLISQNAPDSPVPYSHFNPGPTLWGIGMSLGLDAELLVMGGCPFSGAFVAGQPVVRQDPPDLLAFFAYAHIAQWHEIPVPAHVDDFDELSAFVANIGMAYGFDTQAGFPIRLEAEVDNVDWFVAGGMGDLQPTPIASFLSSRTLGTLGARKISAFGTFSTDLTGVASAPDSSMHVHFATQDDAPLFVGHVNNGISMRPGARIYLPVLAKRSERSSD